MTWIVVIETLWLAMIYRRRFTEANARINAILDGRMQ